MWRAAILRQMTSGPRPLLRRLPTTTSSGTPINIHIHITRALSSHQQDEPPIIPNSSIPKSMQDAQTLEEVMEAVQEQMIEDERRRELENPTPWFSLLHYPSRAAWRSSDHMLGISSNDESKDAAVTPLSQTQFNLIQHSERTNKQLKRTYKRVMETHKTNAIKRERERRMAANLSNPKRQGSATDDGGDGAIKDTKGKMVGNWRDKNKKKKKLASPTNTLCDDPSVALALSIGLSHSKRLHTTDGTADDLAVLESFGVKGIKSASKLAKSRDMSSGKSSKEQSVGYGPEQCLTHIKYRLGPNYSIVKRVLLEVQSLLGGKPPEGSKRKSFQPKRVLDFGSGVGSSSAAALDVFGIRRRNATTDGIDWIHSIDASQCMREATEKVLKSMLENAPWDTEDQQLGNDNAMAEELAEYERLMKQMGRGPTPKQLERQRKRMSKWEHTFQKQTNYRTRLTFGESVVDASSFFADEIDKGDDRPALPWQQQLDEQRRKTLQKKVQSAGQQQQQQKGSFDLILCSYTLSELQNVPSGLTAAALLWEKLAPGGVMVFVEPGTPDGFNILRSVRSMLLECCPPPELKEKRKREVEMMMKKVKEEEDDNTDDGMDEDGTVSAKAAPLAAVEEEWPEECHVLAPCTHNGTCPMSRHQSGHVKHNTRFGKYEKATTPEVEEVEQMEGEAVTDKEEKRENETEEDDRDKKSNSVMDDWASMDDSEREEMKMILGVEGMGDADLEALMKQMDEEMDSDDEGEEYEEDSDDESDDEEDENEFYSSSGKDYYNIEEGQINEHRKESKSTMKQTGVFDASFCSFVHQFPGGARRKKGEKFSYLVLQKRIASDSTTDDQALEGDALDEDIVEMMSKSVHHSNKVKDRERQKRKEQRHFNKLVSDGKHDEDYVHSVYGNYHKNQANDLLQRAVGIEDEYIESKLDKLGLEMLCGDDRRKGWGRLIRAPLKRKGHTLIDYCSAGCGGNPSCGSKNASINHSNGNHHTNDGTQGRIIRQKVSRGWSARAAPGCHRAARKARWGGLWPDLSERVKLAERKDEIEKGMQQK